MTDRPKDFIDYDDEDEAFIGAPPSGAIDYEDEEHGEAVDLETDETEAPDRPPQIDEEEPQEYAAGEDGERDDERVREGVGRAAAVLKYIVEQIVDEPQAIAIGATSDDRGPVLL